MRSLEFTWRVLCKAAFSLFMESAAVSVLFSVLSRKKEACYGL